MVQRHGIAYHEKTLGQLFCDHSAKDIINMLVDECRQYGVTIQMGTKVTRIAQQDDGYHMQISRDEKTQAITAQSVVIATGGPPIPKIGATGFGYQIAKQFGMKVIPDRAGLVPLTFDPEMLSYTSALSGVSIDPARATSQNGKTFDEAMLFTHRGISGPVILQISSYWQQGQEITLNMAPQMDVLAWLKQQRKAQPRVMLHNVLAEILPKRLAQSIADEVYDELAQDLRLADMSDKILGWIAARIQQWRITPAGSEGYRTAEVALGGVDTDELSSKTFESKKAPGLYFIGEVVDVTGHLGGFNFQWAWSSGWCAGQYA